MEVKPQLWFTRGLRLDGGEGTAQGVGDGEGEGIGVGVGEATGIKLLHGPMMFEIV